MIERFNFYDVYGNFLPGLALLALIWLPFGITQHFWPASAFSSAIAALAFAYILGHIVQSVAFRVFPSKAKDSKGKRRYPSSFFLDPEDETFSLEFKNQLEKEVSAAFKLNLSVTHYGGASKEIDVNRRTAFFLCRGLLVREEIVSYGEQFEGLYALMRGLATSFWLGSAYFVGWAASLWENRCFKHVTVAGTFVGLTVATIATGILVLANLRSDSHRMVVDVFTFVSLVISLFCLGVTFGGYHTVASDQGVILGVIAVAALFAGGRCFKGYKYYAEQFAQAIWRDFAGHQMTPQSGKHKDQ